MAVRCNPSLKIPNCCEKYVIYTLFNAKIIIVATKLKALACTLSEVGAQAGTCVHVALDEM